MWAEGLAPLLTHLGAHRPNRTTWRGWGHGTNTQRREDDTRGRRKDRRLVRCVQGRGSAHDRGRGNGEDHPRALQYLREAARPSCPTAPRTTRIRPDESRAAI